MPPTPPKSPRGAPVPAPVPAPAKVVVLHAWERKLPTGHVEYEIIRTLDPADDISPHTAAALLGISRSRVYELLQAGEFKSAVKIGAGLKAHWRLSRREVCHRPQPPAD